MAEFDPDKYLAEKSAAEPAPTPSFDPDAYLAEKSAAAAEPGILDTAKQGFHDFAEGINAIGAGAAQGLTLGFGDELAGGLHTVADLPKTGMDWEAIKKAYAANRDKIRAHNTSIENESPALYTGGNVLGAAAPIAFSGGAGAAAEAGALARSAPSLARIFGESIATGGIAGAGASEADSLSGVGQDALEGAAMGAVVPAAITGVGAGARTVGKGVKALGKTQVLQDLKDALVKTAEGGKLFGKEAKQGIIDRARALGIELGESARGSLNKAGEAVGAEEKALASGGFSADASSTIDKARQMIANLKASIDPTDHADAKRLEEIVDNLTLGLEKDVPVQFPKYSESKLIPEKRIPGKPSSREELEKAAAKMRAEAELMNEPLSTDIREITDDQGNELLALMKKLKNAAGEDVATVKTVPNTPAIPEQVIPEQIIPAELLSNETKMVKRRMGGANPAELDFNQTQALRDSFNRLSGGAQKDASKVDNQSLINFLKGEAQELGQTQAPEGSALRAARDKFGAAKDSLKALGIDVDNFSRNPGTGSFDLDPQGEQKLVASIKKLAVEEQDPFKATGKMDAALDLLAEVDPATAERLRPAIKDVARDIDLATKTGAINPTNPSTFVSKGGALLGAASGSALRNTLGVPAASKVAKGAVKGAQALGYALDDVPASIMGSKNLIKAGSATVGLSQPSRHYSMSDDQIGQAAQALKGTKYEAGLQQALSGDREARNKSLFLISQDPNAKKALEEAGVYE